MEPVFQTMHGEKHGNCFAACIASLLEIPLEDVPQFGDNDWWLKEINEFLSHYGYAYFHTSINDMNMSWMGECYCILVGPNEDGVQHAKIGYHRMDQTEDEDEPNHSFYEAHDPDTYRKAEGMPIKEVGFLIASCISSMEEGTLTEMCM